MKKKILIFLLIAVAAFAAYRMFYGGRRQAGPVTTTGIVEGIETSISSKIAGKLVSVGFREGAAVKTGDLVAVLESRDLDAAYRQSASTLAAERQAEVSGRETVENTRAQSAVARSDIDNAKAALARAEAQLSLSGLNAKRSRELFTRGIISKSDFDTAETAFVAAGADRDALRSAVRSAESREAAAKSAVTKAESDVKTQKARITAAAENVAYQEAKLADTKIFSPTDGVVEYRSLEPGEVVSPGQAILTIVDLKELWVRIDLEQSETSRVKLGSKAKITVENMPGKAFDGTVFDIGREGEFATERDVTRGRQDIKTFRTRIRVSDPEGILKPGMTAMVEIR